MKRTMLLLLILCLTGAGVCGMLSRQEAQLPAAPTAVPTATPTATLEPTAAPTATPEPTEVPTATPEPTAAPTATPTAAPGTPSDIEAVGAAARNDII